MGRDPWRADDELNVCFFTELLDRYGADVQALDWGSRESQETRFSVLAQVGPLVGRSVLDIGCGMGDFLGWLRKRGVDDVEYTGIDITPGMIEIAQQRFPDARFAVVNFLDAGDEIAKSYDFIFASGIFYRRRTAPLVFFEAVLSKMYCHCKRAIAFNSLSSWAADQEEGEFYADPLETLDFSRTLSPWIVLRHNYHPRDFTVFIHRR
jgi:SAM-dependent methyltransferase